MAKQVDEVHGALYMNAVRNGLADLDENVWVGCLGKAEEDEPIFVLRAQDLAAPMVVRHWAFLAEAYGCPPEKVTEALQLATAMEQWPTRKWPD